MQSKYLPVYLLILTSSITLLLANQVKKVYSAANYVVISEIQTTGGTGATNDEFVELYNPTESAFNLDNWKLTKKTTSGTETPIIDATMSGTIAAHGYFLIAHAVYTGSVLPDQSYSGPAILASNNTVLLYNSQGVLVDKVGMGTASDREGDPSPAPAAPDPVANHAIERKASATSTSETMITTEATAGNGEDTDNNANDFVERILPDPQNTSSDSEPELNQPTPSITATPSPTPTPSETPTPTPSPSPTPTDSLTPTQTPTLTPTETPTPTTEEEPSLTPTPTTAEETPTLTPTPTETSGISPFFTSRLFDCHRDYITIDRFGFSFVFPQFHFLKNQ